MTKKSIAAYVSLFFICALMGCQSGGTGTKTIKNSDLSGLNGVWILADYADQLKTTRSPYALRNLLLGISSLSIQTAATADSVEVLAGLNNHEGFTFVIYPEKGHSDQALKTDYKGSIDNGSVEILRENGALVLNEYTENGELVSSKRYVKILDAPLTQGTQGEENPCNLYVNRMLWAGSYAVKEGSGKALGTAAFKENGFVAGLPPFDRYIVQTDFVVEAGNDLDNILLWSSQNENDVTTLAYKMAGNQIQLFGTTETDSATLQVGSLRYTLQRQ